MITHEQAAALAVLHLTAMQARARDIMRLANHEINVYLDSFPRDVRIALRLALVEVVTNFTNRNGEG